MATVKVYRNDSKDTLNVLGVGEIEPGGQVSVSAASPEFLPPVILANYPGLVDVIAEEEANANAVPGPAIEEPQNG